MKQMKLWMHAAILIICGTVSMQAETLRGTVKDAITGEPLIGATVRVVELQGAAAVTDIDGNYLINISQGGRYTIESTYIGYEPSMMKEILISGVKEVVLDIALRENSTELKEVVVRPPCEQGVNSQSCRTDWWSDALYGGSQPFCGWCQRPCPIGDGLRWCVG